MSSGGRSVSTSWRAVGQIGETGMALVFFPWAERKDVCAMGTIKVKALVGAAALAAEGGVVEEEEERRMVSTNNFFFFFRQGLRYGCCAALRCVCVPPVACCIDPSGERPAHCHLGSSEQ